MNKLKSPRNRIVSSVLKAVFLSAIYLSLSAGTVALAQPTNPAARSEVAKEEALLNEVMQRLAAVKSAKADFIETRYLKLLSSPVQSSGVITYTAPDRFEKHSLKPIEEKMTIYKHLVTLEDIAKGRKNTISPASFPALSALIDAMRGALSGNGNLLAETFKVRIEGAVGQWKLSLVPKEAVQYGYIHRVIVMGKADTIDSIEVLQADGDKSVMSMKRASQ
jgi:Outer membrane lipoprotein carrier protein LolA-like